MAAAPAMTSDNNDEAIAEYYRSPESQEWMAADMSAPDTTTTDAQRLEEIRALVGRKDYHDAEAIGFLLSIIDRQNVVVEAASDLIDAFLKHEDTDEPFRRLLYADCTGESVPDRKD